MNKISKKDKNRQRKSLYMTVLMTPDMANFAGVVHGGALLKLLDQVAYSCAARYSKSYVVTLFLDQVYFKEPIYVGELVTFQANVNYVGTSSMEVGVRVIAENLQTQESRHTNSCYFTMVAKDEEGNTKNLPPLSIDSEVEQKLFNAAEMRIKLRKEVMERNDKLHVGGLDEERPWL